MMSNKSFVFFATLFVFSSCMNSFHPTDLQSGDKCAKCQKIITEKRTASEIVFTGNEVMKFNDPGCLVAFHHGIDSRTERAVFVQDYNNSDWIDEEDAFVLYHSTIETPMKSGTVAFNNLTEAEKAKQKYSGELMKLSDLLKKETIWFDDHPR